MPKPQKKKTKPRKGPIGQRYSEKLKKWMWGYDARISDGARGKRRARVYEFETKGEAEEALAAIRRSEREAKYGLAPVVRRPTLQELIEKRLPEIAARAERTRARRVLYTWLATLDPKVKLRETSDRDNGHYKYEPASSYRSPLTVDRVDAPEIREYAARRQAEGQVAASVNRELNIIAATLHQAGEFFSELRQWKSPKIPRPKVTKSRRERLISNDEYERLVTYLRRPEEEGEGKRPQDRRNARRARVRVAQIFEFAMMTAARHGEIVKLKWSDVDWERGRVLIYQSKTDDHKEIPLIRPLASLIEERKPAEWPFVFTQGGNIYPRFYKILRAACEALDIPYGRDTENGLVLHVARHTVTTRLMDAGIPLDTIGLITGHRAKELIAHYGHRHPGSVARAAAALEEMARDRVSNGQNVDKKENR